MPNQHSVDKVGVSVWIERPLYERLVKDQKRRGFKTLTKYIESRYVEATKDIELTAADYKKIAEDTERARKRIDLRKKRKN